MASSHEPNLRDVPANVPADENLLDLSYLDLDSQTLDSNLLAFESEERQERVRMLVLHHNRLQNLPPSLSTFRNLRSLDISSNNLDTLSDAILTIPQLKTLVARNNLLNESSLPKNMSQLSSLEVLNFSGNRFKSFPVQILDIVSLVALYLGGNQLEGLPNDISNLERLKVLYLGGNQLQEIPAEIGKLHNLEVLFLCGNKLVTLPSSLSCLKNLTSLALHDNLLTTLPQDIVTLKGLAELSLRGNPLVVRFIRDMTYDPPRLQELSARCVKINKVPYRSDELPPAILKYLETAHRCLNPKCKGVYFDSRVEHIKFVDFCGKYRIPLLHYLCSQQCSSQLSTSSSSSSDSDFSDEDIRVDPSRLSKVLLG